MANPKVKNGYLPIANELVERLARLYLSPNEWRIIWATWRKTWCWADGERKKDFDWISLSQYEKITGLDRKSICRSIKKIVAKQVLLKSTNGYGFNQNYDEWVVAKQPPSGTTATKGSGDSLLKVVAKQPHTKETITKETITKDNTEQNTQIVELINIFKKIDPLINFGNKTYRKSALEVIQQYSFPVAIKVAEFALSIHGQPYAPSVTNPYQLKMKWVQLSDFYKKKKSKQIKIIG